MAFSRLCLFAGLGFAFLVLGELRASPPSDSQQGDVQSIRWKVPVQFPDGIETVVSGEAAQKIAGFSQAILLRLPGGGTATAQQDVRSRRFYWFMNIQKASLGKRLGFPVTSEVQGTGVSIRKKNEGYQFVDGERPVLFYQQQPKSLEGQQTRANYVHPLFGLDGDVMTQDFPDDHRHHRGIFWAWHQNYVGDRPAGDAWANSNLLSVVKSAEIVEQGPVFATLQAVIHWESPLIVDAAGKPKPFVEETTRIRLFHATRNHQYIDFEIRLVPLFFPVRIGGAENSRGYSGFTARVRPPGEMGEFAIVDESGTLSADAVGTTSRWADVSGRFGKGAAVTGIGILSHPSLPEFPPKWLLRHYGMQNVVYPGREPIEFSARKPLVLRHRIVLHRGDVTEANISEHQRAYEHLQ